MTPNLLLAVSVELWNSLANLKPPLKAQSSPPLKSSSGSGYHQIIKWTEIIKWVDKSSGGTHDGVGKYQITQNSNFGTHVGISKYL